MLRIRSLRNQYQKRLIRPLYAQTQATPYAATIDSGFRTDDGAAFDFAQTVQGQDYTTILTEGKSLLKGSLVPGVVLLQKGEVCVPSAGADAAQTAFGLLANFVGGQLDDLGDENYIGVWRGPDSVYEILKPGFNPGEGTNAATLATEYTNSTVAAPVKLYATVDGRLGALTTPGANRLVVAHLIEAHTNRIVVDLKV